VALITLAKLAWPMRTGNGHGMATGPIRWHPLVCLAWPGRVGSGLVWSGPLASTGIVSTGLVCRLGPAWHAARFMASDKFQACSK